MLYIPFSGANDSTHVNVTKMLSSLELPSARVQPKPSNAPNLDTKIRTERHVSHLNEISSTGFVVYPSSENEKYILYEFLADGGISTFCMLGVVSSLPIFNLNFFWLKKCFWLRSNFAGCEQYSIYFLCLTQILYKKCLETREVHRNLKRWSCIWE